MKTQKFKVNTTKNQLSDRQFWTTIPEKSQTMISGGISLGRKHIHLKQIDGE